MLNFGNISFGRDDNGIRIMSREVNLYLNRDEVDELVDWLNSSIRSSFRYNRGLAQAELPLQAQANAQAAQIYLRP